MADASAESVDVCSTTFHCGCPNLVSQCGLCCLLLQIEAATRNQGPKAGARELLGRIVRGRPGWFSKFLDILFVTEHKRLYNELVGGSPDCDKQGGRLPHR